MPKNKSLIIDDGLDAEISGRAVLDGISYSELLREGAEMYIDIDPYLLKVAKRYAAAMDIKPIMVLANFALGRLAMIEAEKEVMGFSADHMDEFIWIDGKLATGDRLFKMLKALHVQNLSQKKKDRLMVLKEHGLLTEIEKEWLNEQAPAKAPNIKREKIQIGDKTVTIRKDGTGATYAGELSSDEEKELAEILRKRRS